MSSHVGFEKGGVGSRGGFPAGFLAGRVEVVGEVFGVGVAHFPGGGQSGGHAGILILWNGGISLLGRAVRGTEAGGGVG